MADITQRAAEYTKKKEAEEAAKPKSAFSHKQLLDVLLWLHDGFDRSAILFFPIFNNARQVKTNDELRGDVLTIGVRRLEWESGNKRILDAFLGERASMIEKNGYYIEKYLRDEVPIDIYVLPDDVCLTQCDMVPYEYETFMLPNPYERFEQLYG